VVCTFEGAEKDTFRYSQKGVEMIIKNELFLSLDFISSEI